MRRRKRKRKSLTGYVKDITAKEGRNKMKNVKVMNCTKNRVWAIRKTAELHSAWNPWNVGEPAYERGFAPLVNNGNVTLEFEGEGETFLLTVSPSPSLRETGITFEPIRLWVQRNETFPILRALRKKALKTGK